MMAKDPTSTRWGGGQASRPDRRDEDGDDQALAWVGYIAAAIAGLLVLPGALLAVVLVAVWSRWRLDPTWMVPGIAVPLGVVYGYGVDLTPVGSLAAAPSLAGLADVWAAGWPLLVGGGALVATVVTVVRRIRAPGWRKQDTYAPRGAERRGRATARLLASTAKRDGHVLVGVDAATGGEASLPIGSLFRHTLVVGATGSGKTTTVERMIEAANRGGAGGLVVDLKGDPKLVDRWRRRAAAAGVPFAVWELNGGDTVYDPLSGGTVAEIVAKVMALGVGAESDYYRSHAELLLQLVVQAMMDRDVRVTLGSLHRHLYPAEMRGLGPAVAAEVVGTSRERLSALESLRTTLGVLVQSEYGPRLDPTVSDLPTVNLDTAFRLGGIVVMSLPAMSSGHVAGRLAEVVLNDVATIAGRRIAYGSGRPAIVWVDEFSAMKAGPLAGMFARVRGANMGLVLSTQDVQDLLREDPSVLAAVATNVATIVVHRVTFPASAEWIAAAVSTVKGWQETTQVATRTGLGRDGDRGASTGLGSVRQVEQFLLHPNQIKHTPDYVAWVCRTDRAPDNGRLQEVRVVPLDLPDVPESAVRVPVAALAAPSVPRGTTPVQSDGGGRATDDVESMTHDAASITGADRADLPGDEW